MFGVIQLLIYQAAATAPSSFCRWLLVLHSKNDFQPSLVAYLALVFSREQGSPEESVEHLPDGADSEPPEQWKRGRRAEILSGILNRREERLNRDCEGSYLI
ncbi:hypothetical protein LEMLEM_LOCUS15727 [Lemmus lemmus]